LSLAPVGPPAPCSGHVRRRLRLGDRRRVHVDRCDGAPVPDQGHVQPGAAPQQAEQDEVHNLVERLERNRCQPASQDEQRRPCRPASQLPGAAISTDMVKGNAAAFESPAVTSSSSSAPRPRPASSSCSPARCCGTPWTARVHGLVSGLGYPAATAIVPGRRRCPRSGTRGPRGTRAMSGPGGLHGRPP
jgi:hypothetical protein